MKLSIEIDFKKAHENGIVLRADAVMSACDQAVRDFTFFSNYERPLTCYGSNGEVEFGYIRCSDEEHHPNKQETQAALLGVVRDIVNNSRSGLHETLAVRLQGALHKYNGARV